MEQREGVLNIFITIQSDLPNNNQCIVWIVINGSHV